MTKKKKKFVPRFSVRTLLILMTVLACLFAIWGRYVEPFRRQADAINRLGKLAIDAPGADPFSLEEIEIAPVKGPNWQRQLIRLVIGEDMYVQIRMLRFPKHTQEDDIVFVLDRMPFLENVAIERSRLSSKATQSLANLPRLTVLEAKYCDIDDNEFAQLLSNSCVIEKLTLTGNPITDRSVPTFISLESLNLIFVRWTELNEFAVNEIRTKKVSCKVFF